MSIIEAVWKPDEVVAESAAATASVEVEDGHNAEGTS